MRLIDVDIDVNDYVETWDCNCITGGIQTVMAVDDLSYLPTIDAVPVKHGKWVWNPDGIDWGLGAWECSECACRNNNLAMNSKMNPLMFSGSNYCPNCGTKMDGK